MEFDKESFDDFIVDVHAVRVGGRHELACGRTSPYYFGLESLKGHYNDFIKFSKLFIQENFPDSNECCIYGVPYGMSIPASDLSVIIGNGKKVLARKEPQLRAETIIEKYFAGPNPPEEGEKVIIYEDVLTTGNSVEKQIMRAREIGLEVRGIVVNVDRRECFEIRDKRIEAMVSEGIVSTKENLEKNFGIEIKTVTDIHSLLPLALGKNYSRDISLIKMCLYYYSQYGADIKLCEEKFFVKELDELVRPWNLLNNKLLESFIRTGILTKLPPEVFYAEIRGSK